MQCVWSPNDLDSHLIVRWGLLSTLINSLLLHGNRVSSFSFGWNHGKLARVLFYHFYHLLQWNMSENHLCTLLNCLLKRECHVPELLSFPLLRTVNTDKSVPQFHHPEKICNPFGERIRWMETKSLNDFREHSFPTRLDWTDSYMRNGKPSLFSSHYIMGVFLLEHLKLCPDTIAWFLQITVDSLSVSTHTLKL